MTFSCLLVYSIDEQTHHPNGTLLLSYIHCNCLRSFKLHCICLYFEMWCLLLFRHTTTMKTTKNTLNVFSMLLCRLVTNRPWIGRKYLLIWPSLCHYLVYNIEFPSIVSTYVASFEQLVFHSPFFWALNFKRFF